MKLEQEVRDVTTLDVVIAQFTIEDPWRMPDGASGVSLVDSATGNPPRLATTLHVYHDSVRMYFIFNGTDDHVVATHTLRDSPLYEEDVVEIFLSPEDLESYFEIEVSPRGTIFDAAVHSPDGTRKSMKVDRGWDCDLFTAVRFTRALDGSLIFSTVVAMPFSCASRQAPQAGDSWRANFFRIDRHSDGDEFTAWRPTAKSPPDFHVPAAFGELVFR